MKEITIAIDAMGGDYGPEVTIPAAFTLLAKYPHLTLIVVGNQSVLQPKLDKMRPEWKNRLRLCHALQTVTMDESPLQALRYKKASSMRMAINLVKEKKAKAMVSAGNTGALMATARFVLNTLKGIDRPAIMADIPANNPNGFVRVLDLGANVDSSAKHLLQFAIMGSVVATAINGMVKPRIALLNIGEEDIKGNEQVRKAAKLLGNKKALNYVGFVEGNDIFQNVTDVIVCDGFVGNVALKTVEGAARFIAKAIKDTLMQNIFTKLNALIAKPVLHSIVKRLDPSKYNGATLLGLQGIVVKSHGGTNVNGFVAAVEHAIEEVENNVIDLIEQQLPFLLEDRQ